MPSNNEEFFNIFFSRKTEKATSREYSHKQKIYKIYVHVTRPVLRNKQVVDRIHAIIKGKSAKLYNYGYGYDALITCTNIKHADQIHTLLLLTLA